MSSPVNIPQQTVPMFAPDGTLGDIPAERLRDAMNAGFKPGVTMKTADGKLGVIPADRVQEAAKSGMQIVPLGEQDTQHPGFWHSLYSDLSGMAKGMMSAPLTELGTLDPQKVTAIGQAMGNDQERKAAGYSGAYRAIAPLAASVTNVTGMEQSAKEGDRAGVAGHAAATPVAMAATAGLTKALPNAVEGMKRAALLGRTPEEAYQSALKPSTTLPVSKVDSIVQTGLKNQIPVTAGGVEKLGALIDDLNSKIKNVIASDPTRPINSRAVVSKLPQTADRFANQVNPEADLSAIKASRDEFLSNNPGSITAEQAQAMKQGTYQQLKSKSYGELKGASIEAQKALARGLKDEIAKQFPELSQLNASESKMFDLQPVLEKAVQRIGNHQLIGIGTPIATGAAKALTGSSGAAYATGILKAVLDNPGVKSRLAIALSKGGKMPPATAFGRVAAYSAALASAAANSDTPDDRTTQSQP